MFTLPAGYRPSTSSYFDSMGDTISGAYVVSTIKGIVNTDGTVAVTKTTAATVERVFVACQVFLDAPSSP